MLVVALLRPAHHSCASSRPPDDGRKRCVHSFSLQLPPHSTGIGSLIASDATYDQLAFFPGPTQTAFVQAGVFDYDGSVFADHWANHRNDYLGYLRYYISDHRPLWSVFRV